MRYTFHKRCVRQTASNKKAHPIAPAIANMITATALISCSGQSAQRIAHIVIHIIASHKRPRAPISICSDRVIVHCLLCQQSQSVQLVGIHLANLMN
ncbi:hypothetical protein KC957_04035, partial [Candidatus Saccharibacteria bacterium]|nr:hypothetical protein [Candidatus Saccharibacteria bacterium]